MKKHQNLTKALVESSIMIALGTVLSILKLVEMPYGGSVTLASMLPIVIVAYRHGTKMGMGAGVVFAVIQQLLGLKNLSYFTTWQSVVAVILLDYMLAFAAVGLGGIFRGRLTFDGESARERQYTELSLGMLTVCLIRYIFHTVAGATVWVGLSIPTEAALIYSIGYNATYMIPETVISVAVSLWLGGIMDFTRRIPVRFSADTEKADTGIGVIRRFLPAVSAFTVTAAVITDAILISPHLQNPEDGSFTFSLLSSVNWVAVIIVSAVALAIALASLIISRIRYAK